jgi:hypothetical protein
MQFIRLHISNTWQTQAIIFDENRLTEWLSGSVGTGETPSPLSRNFWQTTVVASGGAAVRWNLPGWRGHPSILNET